jgi:chorismate synthase
MNTNSFGRLLNVTSYGESHGPHVGVVIVGCPAGLQLDLQAMQQELDRRKPGGNHASERNEDDVLEIVSGVDNTITTGAPICIIIHNKNTNGGDYTNLEHVFRPGHADYSYYHKYGNYHKAGGGRSSARLTAGWVAAGALAKQLLNVKNNLEFCGEIYQIGSIKINENNCDYSLKIKGNFECYDAENKLKMQAYLDQLKQEGDTTGGVIRCTIKNVPIGWGEPLGHKLSAALAHAMISINAAHAFEYGSGMAGTTMRGSEHNDAMQSDGFLSNHAGGILGGISNGNDLVFKVGFKPISSIKTQQQTIDNTGQNTTIAIAGRHDPCPVVRAVPIVEAMAALVLADMMLFNQLSKL